jgi:hypothetical protein
VTEALRRSSPKKPNQLHVVLEAGHANSGDAERVFFEMKAQLANAGTPILATFTLQTKDDCDPLMVVDLLAHVTFTDDMKRRSGGIVSRAKRQPGNTAVMILEVPSGKLADMRKRLLAGEAFVRMETSPNPEKERLS